MNKKVRRETYAIARNARGQLQSAGILDRLFGPRTTTVKRDCVTGRFLPLSARANACGTSGRGPKRTQFDERETRASSSKVCYRTKRELAGAFWAFNRDRADFGAWPLGRHITDGSYDSVREKTGVKVTTLRGAIMAAMPTGKPWCMDRVDLEVLNETRPGIEAGGFEIPDNAHERAHLAELQAHYDMEDPGLPF